MGTRLSWPLRLTPTGAYATVEEGTDRDYDELVAIHSTTAMGERPYVPEFGVPPLVFGGLTKSSLQDSVDRFGPDVRIRSVTLAPQVTDENRTIATIRWVDNG